MEYNSVREDLVIPEFGRNVQKLIKHARTIEDLEYRQAYIEKIIDLIYILNPQTKNVMDYKNKLWKQVFKIADYDLPGVIPPNGEIPTREGEALKPAIMAYPPLTKRLRHYGYYVQVLIEKAIQMEEGPVKTGFISNIASFMKMAYQNWNSEHYVSDEVILDDLRTLSKGKLKVTEDIGLDLHSQTIKKSHRANVAQKAANQKPRGKGKSNKGRKHKPTYNR